jgi:hypothetical protein
MSFDNTPSRLEAVFFQRDKTNQYYEEINISASNAVVYLDESGSLTADNISVWAAKYGIGGGTTPISVSYASSSMSSSYALTASYALNGSGGSGGTQISCSWASASISSSHADTASYFITSSVTSASYALTASSINFIPTVAVSASWVSASNFITTAQTASYVTASNVVGTVSSASFAISASWAPSTPSVSASYAFTSSFALNGGGTGGTDILQVQIFS